MSQEKGSVRVADLSRAVPSLAGDPGTAAQQALLERLAPFDRERESNTRPDGWTNPAPAKKYGLVVVGGGTAGLTVAMAGASQGLKVALVEKARLGGRRLHGGEVPFSALAAASQVFSVQRRGAAHGLGLDAAKVKQDTVVVLENVARRRAEASRAVSVARLQALGIDVFFGEARFTGPAAVDVGGAALRFEKACITTGSRPATGGLTGLGEGGFTTVDEVWSLTMLPKRVVVLGVGSEACAYAQVFARLGARVSILDHGERLLPDEEPETEAAVAASLALDGVEPLLGASIDRVIRVGAQVGVAYRGPAGSPATADLLLVARGRVPNVEGLGLEEAGVRADAAGIGVDALLTTSNQKVFAAGSVTASHLPPPATPAMARAALAQLRGTAKSRWVGEWFPSVVRTEPPVARIGPVTESLVGQPLERVVEPLLPAASDQAPFTDGFVVLLAKPGADVLDGVTLCGPGAPELSLAVSEAMAHKTGIAALADGLADTSLLTSALRRALERLHATRGPAKKGFLGGLLR